VRADVVVRAPTVEAALGHFAALLEGDLEDLVEVRVFGMKGGWRRSEYFFEAACRFDSAESAEPLLCVGIYFSLRGLRSLSVVG
jgi:hypothetical protein